MYEDTSCRLCNETSEDINHVLNECVHVQPKVDHITDDDIYGNDLNKLEMVVKKMHEFCSKVKEKESLQQDT